MRDVAAGVIQRGRADSQIAIRRHDAISAVVEQTCHSQGQGRAVARLHDATLVEQIAGMDRGRAQRTERTVRVGKGVGDLHLRGCAAGGSEGATAVIERRSAQLQTPLVATAPPVLS